MAFLCFAFRRIFLAKRPFLFGLHLPVRNFKQKGLTKSGLKTSKRRSPGFPIKRAANPARLHIYRIAGRDCHLIAVGDYRGLMVYQAIGLINPWSYVDNQSSHYLRSRHPRGANVAFCDGHAESLGRKQRWPLSQADHSYSQRWNNDNQPHPETWP